MNSVQYPNLISTLSIAAPLACVFSDISAFGSEISNSVTFPVSASYIPLRTTTSPCPPESTTPASFNTGSRSGVVERTYSACSIIVRRASSRFSVCDATSAAFSEIPLATVRIVPSFGFMTAL